VEDYYFGGALVEDKIIAEDGGTTGEGEGLRRERSEC
jgi:hypothetical protein